MRKNMIKWKPFYSIPGLNKIIKEIEEEKNYKYVPSLSDDLIFDINQKLINSIENKSNISIKYIKNGMLYYKNGVIEKIDTIQKYILISNIRIYFNEIIKIDDWEF